MTALYCHISQRSFRKIDTQQPPEKKEIPFRLSRSSGTKWDEIRFCELLCLGRVRVEICRVFSIGVAFRGVKLKFDCIGIIFSFGYIIVVLNKYCIEN